MCVYQEVEHAFMIHYPPKVLACVLNTAGIFLVDRFIVIMTAAKSLYHD